MDEVVFSAAVEAIYNAAASPAAWPRTLGHLGAIFGCSCVSLIDRNRRTLESSGTAWGVDLGAQQAYFNYWGRLNPIVRRKHVWRAGEIDTDRHILPKSDLMATDYYNGFMKPHDMHAILRLTLAADADSHQVINFARPVAAGEFEPVDIDVARRFLPHLQRAAQIAQRLRMTDVLLGGLTAVLEESTAGVLLLDARAQVVYANAAARTMAAQRDAFVIRRKRVEALDRRGQAAFQSLVQRATQTLPGAGAVRAGAIRLPRLSERTPYHAVVAPLPRNEPWCDAAVAFVVIADAEQGAPPDPILGDLFGFSPAEIRMARRLMLGEAPEQAAEALNIRISTARWHLASMYRKTGTERQAQLVRLLASLPPLKLH